MPGRPSPSPALLLPLLDEEPSALFDDDADADESPGNSGPLPPVPGEVAGDVSLASGIIGEDERIGVPPAPPLLLLLLPLLLLLALLLLEPCAPPLALAAIAAASSAAVSGAACAWRGEFAWRLPWCGDARKSSTSFSIGDCKSMPRAPAGDVSGCAPTRDELAST